MSERLRRELKRWGFSDGEISVYLAILEAGEESASAIADRADMSSRHIYRVCRRLEDRGLIDVDDHVQPTRVRARPPEAVSDVIDRVGETITEEVESLYANPAGESTAIEVLKRQSTVLSRARDLISGAERWVVVVAPADAVEDFADALETAVDRGILVFLVTNVAALPIDDLDRIATVVRTRETAGGFQEFGLGADRVESLMVTPSTELGDDHRYSPALYVHDDTIAVRTNESVFGIEWRHPDEYLVPDLIALPYRTEFFRDVVLQAALYDRQDRAVRATVEGRWIDDGAAVTLEGIVRAVRQGVVEPFDQSFIGERTLVLDTNEGRATVGGPKATIEDVAAEAVTLFSAGETDP